MDNLVGQNGMKRKTQNNGFFYIHKRDKGNSLYEREGREPIFNNKQAVLYSISPLK